jgi:hypothetical protein
VWAEYSYTGSPLKPPFFIKWILRLQKRKFLYGQMRAGVKIPGVEGGTLATRHSKLPTTGLLSDLRAATRHWTRYTDQEARQTALSDFHKYAYQWC